MKILGMSRQLAWTMLTFRLVKVYTLLVLDLLQTAFTTNYVHGVLVAGWGNPAPLVEFSWSGTTIPIMTGLGKWPFSWASVIHRSFSRITYRPGVFCMVCQ